MASPPPSPPQAKKPKVSSDDDEEAAAVSVAETVPSRPPLPVPGDGTGKPRYKRRKVAIFFGYCGAGYQGMQKNPGAKTIEGDLEEALYLAWAVPEADRGCPRRYDWARSARTDKGVSALGQVISGRFYVDPPGLVERLNAHLPDQIRIFGFKRVTASFSAKKFCDRRRYIYLLPVFALDPEAHRDRESVMASLGSGSELAKCVECSERGRKVPGVMGGRLENNKLSRVVVGEGRGELGDIISGEADHAGGLDDISAVTKAVSGKEQELQEAIHNSEVGSEDADGETDLAVKLKLNPEVYISVPVERVDIGQEVNSSSSVPEAELASSYLLKEEGSATEMTGSVEKSMGTSNSAPEGTNSREAALCMSAEDADPAVQTPATASKFQYSEKLKERFNRILKRYVGTHNFHNFTTRTKAEDPSARRYIVSFEANTVVNLDGLEYVRCEVVGQSFMLHQIRKMIGLAVAIMRNCTPESVMDSALKQDTRINVPTAPEVGLYLEECLFSSYNNKWRDSHEILSMEPYVEHTNGLKMKYIYPYISSMEQKEGSVALWLHSLNHRNYPDFHFTETNGAGETEDSPKAGI